MTWEEIKPRLAQSSFRSRFKLSQKETAILAEKGWFVIEGQAEAIIRKRLAPANPLHDGKQTPMRGHPVFPAQHATATCCRGCLQKWYGIPQGRPMTEDEIHLAVTMILRWLHERTDGMKDFPEMPDLFS